MDNTVNRLSSYNFKCSGNIERAVPTFKTEVLKLNLLTEFLES